MKKIISIGIAVAFLSGCATNLNSIKPVDDMATIIAYSDSSAGVLLPLSSTKTTRIEKVDGKQVSNFFTEKDVFNVTPGPHDVVISCHIIHGGINVSSNTNHQIIAEAGKQYIFKAELGGDGCLTNYIVK